MLPEASTTSNSLNLSAFPLEVLSVLATFISGRDIALLWNCGCSRLNVNLGARGAVRKFSLELDPLFPSKWPSIIDNLPHVSELSIRASKHASQAPLLEDLLLRAPLTLRTLVLVHTQAFSSFLQALPRSPSVFSTLETLKLEFSADTMWHVDEAKAIKALESLTSLHLSTTSYYGPFADLIPPNLTYLYLNFEYCEDVVLDLPTSLLTFTCWIGEFDKFREIAAFPPGLTKLCLLSQVKKFTAAEVSRLPLSLTYLDANADFESKEIMSALPPYLRTLKNSYGESMPKDDIIKQYPRQLTKINVHRPITIENVEFLPPRLVALSRVSQDLGIIPKLPANLKKLEFLPLRSIVDVGDSVERVLFPKCLTRITNLNIALLSRCELPATMKYLDIRGATFNPEHSHLLPAGLEQLVIQGFASGALMSLPRGLTLLSVGEIGFEGPDLPFTAELATNLPSTLTSLRFDAIDLETPEAFYLLPQGLEILTLGTQNWNRACDLSKAPSSLRDLALSVRTHQDGLAHALISSLPRKLASAEIYVGSTTTASDIGVDAFERLPPGLTRLQIPATPLLDASTPRPPNFPPHLQKVFSAYKTLFPA